MLFGNAKGEVTHVHRQVSHAQTLLCGQLLDMPREILARLFVCLFVTKLIMPFWHRGVGGKGAEFAYLIVLKVVFLQQSKRHKSAVTLVHMKRFELIKS